MNGTTDQPHNNQRLIVICVLVLGVACIIGGTVLTFKGYNAELLIGGGTSSIAGLLGVLSNRPSQPPPDITVSGQPPKVVVTRQPKPQPDEPVVGEPNINKLI